MSYNKKVNSENIMVLYCAKDRMAWIMNESVEERIRQASNPGDDIITGLQINIDALVWELLEAITCKEYISMSLSDLGEIVFYLRLLSDFVNHAKPNEELAMAIEKSFKNGVLSTTF